MAVDAAAEQKAVPRRRRRAARLSRGDRVAVTLMVGIPLLVVVGLVWLPTLLSGVLSFTSWDGIGGVGTIEWVGTRNYQQIFEIYPPFWPAFRHNIIWLVFLTLVPTVLGLLLAYLLDKRIRGTRAYQSIFFMPVVLSLAVVGFITQLIYSYDIGALNSILGNTENPTDWLGDPNVNLWAALAASSWRHVGYVMLLYLAGLKAVDASLREAASLDGASETQTFFRVVFPVMRPINIIVLVITVIEALRAFDLVWVINKGRNGLELIATLVTANVVGEASRIGFGSAMATIMLVISSVFVAIYLVIVMREGRDQ